jgi:hypothetical protein
MRPTSADISAVWPAPSSSARRVNRRSRETSSFVAMAPYAVRTKLRCSATMQPATTG